MRIRELEPFDSSEFVLTPCRLIRIQDGGCSQNWQVREPVEGANVRNLSLSPAPLLYPGLMHGHSVLELDRSLSLPEASPTATIGSLSQPLSKTLGERSQPITTRI